MRPRVAKRPVRPQRLLSLALVALACGASFAHAQEALPPTRPALPDAEIRALVDYAEMFRLCEIFDLARVFYDAALDRTRTMQPDAPLRLEIEARYVVYTFRVGAPQWRQNLIGSVLERLPRSGQPLLLHWRYRIEACQARSKRDWPRFHDLVQKALLETVAAPKPLLYKAETARLKAEGLYEEGQQDEAIRMAKSALQFHSLAGEPLYKTDMHRLIALCHEANGNTQARNISRERVVNTISDLRHGPLLNLDRVARETRAIQDAQRNFAAQGQYDQAIYAAVTLLNLKKARAEGRVGEIQMLNQEDLLASAALYMRGKGHAEAGEVMFAQAKIAASKRISPLAKAQYRYAAARYLRIAGRANAALDSLSAAERILRRIGHNDAQLDVAILEERGLCLLAMKKPAAAVHAFEDARSKSELAGLAEPAERYNRFLAEIRKGNTSPDDLTMPKRESPEETRRAARIAMRTSGPALFQSPFMTDRPDPQAQSAAQAAMSIPLSRPRPSPTPIRMSADILMRTGDFRRAIGVLENEIQRQGESLERLLKLGQCYNSTRQWSEARQVFQRALEIDPGNARARGYINEIDELVQTKRQP